MTGGVIRFPDELHFFNSNFIGPGIRTDLSLDENDEPLPHSIPINKIDAVALNHDLGYKYYGDTKTGQHILDKIMVEELDSIPYSSLTPSEKIQKFLVRNTINLKEKLGLGNEPVSESQAAELHHRIVRNFPRRKVIVNNIDEIWSADLVEMPNDKGFHYILTVIDCFSKYSWTVPLKNKQSQTVINAFKNIIEQSKRSPNKLWTDAGSEFINKQFKKFLEENKIELYHTNNEGKAVVIERFNRTLKEKMWFKFTVNGNKQWLNILQDITNQYNHSIHRSIKMTPVFASRKENENRVKENLQSYIKDFNLYNPPEFKINDLVRIYKYKSHFEKGYETNFSREIFKIVKVLHTLPVTYKIEALDGEEIVGSFYSNELVKHHN